MMGTGEASGEQRAIVASEEAIVNPLLDDTSLKGAKSLLLSITGGPDLTLWEVDEAANRVRQEVDPDANIIVGATFDEALGEKVRVSIVASGMGHSQAQARAAPQQGWAPRSAPATLPPQAHDYRLSLSEAIGNANAAGPPGHAAEDAWPPGNVYITERAPQLSPLGHAVRLEDQALSAAQGAHLERPQSGPKSGPKSLFPQLQREPWAKSDAGAPEAPVQAPFVYQRQPEGAGSNGSPKGSLLRRLAGRALGRRQASGTSQYPQHSNSTKALPDSREQVDLPVFFGGGKR
jgi:cell division protein FtsZ